MNTGTTSVKKALKQIDTELENNYVAASGDLTEILEGITDTMVIHSLFTNLPLELVL